MNRNKINLEMEVAAEMYRKYNCGNNNIRYEHYPVHTLMSETNQIQYFHDCGYELTYQFENYYINNDFNKMMEKLISHLIRIKSYNFWNKYKNDIKLQLRDIYQSLYMYQSLSTDIDINYNRLNNIDIYELISIFMRGKYKLHNDIYIKIKNNSIGMKLYCERDIIKIDVIKINGIKYYNNELDVRFNNIYILPDYDHKGNRVYMRKSCGEYYQKQYNDLLKIINKFNIYGLKIIG